MSVSPVSAPSPVHTTQAAQHQAQENKTAQQQPDTVQLSPAAQAQLKSGGDADRDGDSK
jgi:hypothetical protein